MALSYIEDVDMSRSECQSMTEYIRVNGRRYPPLFVLTSDKIRVNEGNDLDWKKGGRNRSHVANRHINTANTVDRPKLLILLNLYIKDIYKKCNIIRSRI